jgi:hypothetical protein
LELGACSLKATDSPGMSDGAVFHRRLPQLPVHLSAGDHFTVLMPMDTVEFLLADRTSNGPEALQARFHLDGHWLLSPPLTIDLQRLATVGFTTP